ncbi:hypothetical protein [Xenophilus sp. Marseille-Q4582]|uniref:hypothetical protein n=1 Tax=Xenophilus sp. Marseille-Q4582 TaxID=2866600 RepID=UPI001CE420B8|nr:hypothetical protein [Xenophilus sp. Marseille-Q4582]
MRIRTHTPWLITLLPLLLAGCAATAPPARDFPAGVRAPSASELAGLLRGKSFTFTAGNGVAVRTDYAAEADGVTAYFSGRSDRGTWRTEDGKVCFQFKVIPSVCNDVRLAGPDMYLRRANGEVVRVTAR